MLQRKRDTQFWCAMTNETETIPDGAVRGWARKSSPYHRGEIMVQERAGARDFSERVGRRIIRDFMPDQHRAFFEKLPYVFMGSLDREGRPWASILSGQPGFLQTPDARSLVVSMYPIAGEPARENLTPGAPLAFVGVEFHTRRRNRLTGRIRAVDGDQFVLAVDQSFGNCPQYIQARAAVQPNFPFPSPLPRRLGSRLDADASAVVSSADTFFITTASPGAGSDDPVEGVDVSHRGGRPGFVRIETIEGLSALTIPDFAGNRAFNTLGNITINPRAGLLFIDFYAGDLVTLTGTAQVIWDGPELSAFQGAERLLRVTVDEAIYWEGALPWHWTAPKPSSRLKGTGDWQRSITTLADRADNVGHASPGTQVGPIRRLFKSFQRSLAILQQRRMLQGSPGYLLKDIGIDRSEIDSLVMSIVNGVPDVTRRSIEAPPQRRNLCRLEIRSAACINLATANFRESPASFSQASQRLLS